MTNPDQQETVEALEATLVWLSSYGYAEAESVRNALTLLKAQQEQIIESEAKAICYVSHNIEWLGGKGTPGWCRGCGEHYSSLFRESSEEQL